MSRAETNGREVVEIPKEEFEDLVQRIEELEKELDEIRIETAEDRASIRRRVSDLEESTATTDFVPKSKKDKAKKLIRENFDEWGHNGEISTKTQKNERGNIVSRSIHDYVGDAMDRECNESIQHGQVYDAMRELGTAEAFTFERTDSARYLIRSE